MNVGGTCTVSPVLLIIFNHFFEPLLPVLHCPCCGYYGERNKFGAG
jgi:hypothetical protein